MTATPSAPDDSPAEGFVLSADEGDAFYWLGSLTINKVGGRSTKGGVDVVDHRVPAGYAPPLHVHRAQDETFYVLEGRFTFHCGDRTWQAGPGSLGFLPRGIPHGFSVSADRPGRTLLINAPAGFAEVISELGERAPDLVIPGPDVAMPDPARVQAISEAHGIFPRPGTLTPMSAVERAAVDRAVREAPVDRAGDLDTPRPLLLAMLGAVPPAADGTPTATRGHDGGSN